MSEGSVSPSSDPASVHSVIASDLPVIPHKHKHRQRRGTGVYITLPPPPPRSSLLPGGGGDAGELGGGRLEEDQEEGGAENRTLRNLLAAEGFKGGINGLKSINVSDASFLEEMARALSLNAARRRLRRVQKAAEAVSAAAKTQEANTAEEDEEEDELYYGELEVKFLSHICQSNHEEAM